MSNHLTTKPPFEKTEKPDTSKQVATKSAAEKIEKAEKMKVFEDKHVLKMLVYLTADFCRNHYWTHDHMASLEYDTASNTSQWLIRMENWIEYDPNVGRKQESPAEWRPLIKLIVKTLKSLPKKDRQSVYVHAMGLAFSTLRRESTLYIKDREENKSNLSKDVEIMATMKAKVLEKDVQTLWEENEVLQRLQEMDEGGEAGGLNNE